MGDEELKIVLKEHLDDCTCPLAFKEVWEKAQEQPSKSKPVKLRKLRVILAFAAALILAVGIGATAIYEMRRDDTSYSFKNDEKVLGEWKVVDFVNQMEDFDPQHSTDTDLLYLRGFDFKAGGRLKIFAQEVGKDMFDGERPNSWSKGYINNYEDETKSIYKIKKIEGKEYLFYQHKSGDYVYSVLDYTPYYVLERGTPTERDLTDRVMDDISYSFVNDPDLLGEWKLVDLVDAKEKFNPNERQHQEGGGLSGLAFEENGKILSVIEGRKAPVNPGKWSKGYVIIEGEMLRLEYETREIDGKDYLFYEHKNVEYVMGLVEDVPYYVFERVE